MPKPVLRPPVVTLSVDLVGCRRPHDGQTTGKRLAASEIGRALDDFGLPATWIIDGGAGCRMAAPLLALEGNHEIALAADSRWAGRGVHRKVFATELATRQLRARANGYSVTSLFLPGAQEIAHPDLALKYGLSVVCPVAEGMPPAQAGSPFAAGLHSASPSGGAVQTICFGLWQVPVSLFWEAGGGPLRRFRGRHDLNRAIARVSASGGAAHILVDAQRLTGPSRRRVGALEKTLRRLETHRQSGRIEIDTLAGLVRRLSAATRPSPSRSILRPAA